MESVVDGLRQARERCLIALLRADHDVSVHALPVGAPLMTTRSQGIGTTHGPDHSIFDAGPRRRGVAAIIPRSLTSVHDPHMRSPASIEWTPPAHPSSGKLRCMAPPDGLGHPGLAQPRHARLVSRISSLIPGRGRR